MNAKEKANGLYNDFYLLDGVEDSKTAKQCALICVGLLIEVTSNADELITKMISIMPDKEYFKEADKSKAATYWNNVKTEIEKL